MVFPSPVCNVLIDNIEYIPTLLDSGCEIYSLVSENVATRLQLRRIEIRPMKFKEVVKKENKTHTVREAVKFNIDFDGYKRDIWGYVVPGLSEPLILGSGWFRDENASVDWSKQALSLGYMGLDIPLVHNSGSATTQRLLQISAPSFMALSRRIRKKEGKKGLEARVYAASLSDINKALKPKVKGDPEKLLPPQYRDYLKAFSREDAKTLPPHRPGIDHHTELLKDDQGCEQQPPWGPLYKMTRDELLVLRRTLTDLLDKGFIRASNSPAGAPVLFAHKPGGGLRFCVDYRGLNGITRKDRTPLPLIQETLAALSKAKYFTKLDVAAAFHKIRIAKGQEWMTAFRTRYGLFEYTVTPFGLTNAPATFQRYINWTLRQYLDEFCSAYVDDVLVYTSGSLQDHRKKVRLVLGKLMDAGLTLDIDKCEFEQRTVKYLGYIVTAGYGVSMDPEKVRAIRSWERPTNQKGVRSFLGFANYYRTFIDGFSKIAAPLTRLTGKNIPFEWCNETEQAFETLKGAFLTAPALAQFDPDAEETHLEADASGYATGGALLQRKKDGLFRPVAYFSQRMTPAECNYEIHDKELLAIIKCLVAWSSELRSVRQFTIVTDHKNLEYFLKKQRLSERQARWALELSRFNYDLKYRKGALATLPDGLSRRPQDMPKNANDSRLTARTDQVLKPARFGAIETLPNENLNDCTPAQRDTSPTPTANNHNPLANDEDLSKLWEEAINTDDSYTELLQAVRREDRKPPQSAGPGISLAKCALGEGHTLRYRHQLWVPNHEPLRTAIIAKIHENILNGHPGRETTFALLQREFYWPGYSRDVERYVRNCQVCGRTKAWKDKKHGLLQPLPVPARIWSDISMDFIVDLPPAKPNGATNLLVITDLLSKGVKLVPMVRITAEATAQAIVDHIVANHGLPNSTVSDRGGQFAGEVWEIVCKLLGIKRKLSTAYHPETDGATERMNQVVEQFLRAYCSFTQDDWGLLCCSAQLAINNRPASATGMSPFFLMHGYNVDSIQADLPNNIRNTRLSPAAAAETIVRKLRDGWETAQASIAWAKEKQEEYTNRKRSPEPRYKEGDYVWLALKNISTARPNKKLDWKNAKYKVTKVVNPLVMELDTPPGIYNRFHVSLLHPASNNPFPSQVTDDERPPPIVDEGGDEEWGVEKILRVTKQRALVKWIGYAKPTWEPIQYVKDTEAYEKFLQN